MAMGLIYRCKEYFTSILVLQNNLHNGTMCMGRKLPLYFAFSVLEVLGSLLEIYKITFVF
jgi:hypothetical protein